MSGRIDWQRARERDVLRKRLGEEPLMRYPGKRGKRKPKGITNKQARFLAALQRQAREPYAGNGLTAFQASQEIDRLIRAKSQ